MKNLFWKRKPVAKDTPPNPQLKGQFEDLLKTLIALSLPYEQQKAVYGIGATADEMLNDFYDDYTLLKKDYLQYGLIDERTKVLLDKIDTLTDQWTAEKETAFWFEMDKYTQDWDQLRSLAKATLTLMGKSHLGLAVKHENEYDEKGKILLQRTTITLKGAKA